MASELASVADGIGVLVLAHLCSAVGVGGRFLYIYKASKFVDVMEKLGFESGVRIYLLSAYVSGESLIYYILNYSVTFDINATSW